LTPRPPRRRAPGQVGAFFNLVGVALLCIIVPVVAPKRPSAKWVFTAFEPAAAISSGITNPL
jgi:hypothetical protein